MITPVILLNNDLFYFYATVPKSKWTIITNQAYYCHFTEPLFKYLVDIFYGTAKFRGGVKGLYFNELRYEPLHEFMTGCKGFRIL